jgi:hypothetical protein
MAHRGPNSERNLYGSPHNLWPAGFPGGAKVAIFAVLTVSKDCARRTKMDERAILFYLDGHCATFKWWLCPLHSLSLLNNRKKSRQCQTAR